MAIIQCPECKKEVSDRAGACPSCGYPISQNISQTQYSNDQSTNAYNYQSNHERNYNKEDLEPSTGYAILGFFIPIVGLILYLVWKSEKPGPSKSAGTGALIGFIIGFILMMFI